MVGIISEGRNAPGYILARGERGKIVAKRTVLAHIPAAPKLESQDDEYDEEPNKATG